MRLSGWAALPAVATLVVTVGILAHSVPRLTSPCVAWGYDDFYKAYDDLPRHCGKDTQVTPQSAAWGWTLVVAGTIGLLVACTVAWLGVLRNSPWLWWAGFVLMAAASFGPRTYVAYGPEVQMTVDTYIARPFGWGVILLPAFFAAMRYVEGTPMSMVQGTQTISAILVILEAALMALLLLTVVMADYDDPDSEAIPPDQLLPVDKWQAWLIFLMPPAAVLASFHHIPGRPPVFRWPRLGWPTSDGTG